jgi:L-arabinose isomerase
LSCVAGGTLAALRGGMVFAASEAPRVAQGRLATESSRPEKVRRYFLQTRLGLAEDESLEVIRFGEYLVEQLVIDRFQLFRALQLQDAVPGVRIGAAVSALGYCSEQRIEWLHDEFAALATIEV